MYRLYLNLQFSHIIHLIYHLFIHQIYPIIICLNKVLINSSYKQRMYFYSKIYQLFFIHITLIFRYFLMMLEFSFLFQIMVLIILYLFLISSFFILLHFLLNLIFFFMVNLMDKILLQIMVVINLHPENITITCFLIYN